MAKIARLQDKLSGNEKMDDPTERPHKPRRKPQEEDLDASWHEDENAPSTSRGGPFDEDEDDGFVYRPRPKSRKPHMTSLNRAAPTTTISIAAPIESSSYLEPDTSSLPLAAQTPRTKRLIAIINTRDVNKIKLLKGVGSKKAEAIVNCLCDLDDLVDQDSSSDEEKSEKKTLVKDLNQLGKLKGVGAKTVWNMRVGLGEF
jgi:DNA uptake protein ComE-like DNA-binding protein